MSFHLVDTHCHLDEESFGIDRDDVVARAVSAGVTRMVTIGTTVASSRAAIALAKSHAPHVFAAVGIHPNYVAQAAEDDWDRIRELVREPGVVAIGETGLDRYWDHTPLAAQQDYFDRHLALSRETGLPFIVHCRDAEAETVAQLVAASKQGGLNGIMHSFAGSPETAKICLDLGLLLSFSGMVTFKKSSALRDVVTTVPADRLLVETDAPYLAPSPHRGKRNEPEYTRHTLACIADLRGEPVEQLARQTTENASRLFGWTLAEQA
jgi:TatD DNase family protein